jgi:hypothetical protein
MLKKKLIFIKLITELHIGLQAFKKKSSFQQEYSYLLGLGLVFILRCEEEQ